MMLNNAHGELCISAPGNILLFGGYHVLIPGSCGVIMSTDSRIYITVNDTACSSNEKTRIPLSFLISVTSPQFTDEAWVYRVSLRNSNNNHENRELQDSQLSDNEGEICLSQLKGEKNKFISLTLRISLLATYGLCKERFLSWLQSGRGMNITILADNDFYSQRSNGVDTKLEAVLRLPKFSFIKSPLNGVTSTGLGSSSALVSGLSCAIICYLSGIDIEVQKYKKYCLSVAQFIHFVVQSLLGSGADIATAFFGSHLYKSPDRSSLVSIMSKKLRGLHLTSNDKDKCLINPQEFIEDYEYSLDVPIVNECVELISTSCESNIGGKRIIMPPGLLLVSLDVSTGTKSSACSKKFLLWLEKSKKSYEILAKDYSTCITTWVNTLESLLLAYSSNKADYASTLEILATKPASLWNSSKDNYNQEIVTMLAELVKCSKILRSLFTRLGDLANLSTEPSVLSPLIDYISSLNGVIWTGTTGAGGYDAISLIVLSERVPSSKDEEIAYRMRAIASIHKSVIEWLSKNSGLKQNLNFDEYPLKHPLPLFDGATSYFSSSTRIGLCVEPRPPFSLVYNI